MATRRGFTLIEVLVVLVIAAIVMSVLVSVMGSSFEILRAGESKAKLTANARLLIDYIANDLQSAAYIPLSSDRDLNGWPDEADNTLQRGYREDAVWRVARVVDDTLVVHSSHGLSEAWSDRIMTRHFSSGFGSFFGVEQEGTAVPKIIRQAGSDRSAQWISLIRLAIPANEKMPYYLSQESDRNGDGTVDPVNTGSFGPGAGGMGVIQGYPEQVAIGPHKETAVAMQDYWYALEGDEEFKRVRQIPIASNITRIRFEYFHEVPVYQSRATGGNLQVFAQNVEDGSVDWIPANGNRSDEMVPLIDHWEQRQVDVAYNAANAGGLWRDPPTGTLYGIMSYRLQDQYPEGYNDLKRTGTHVSPATGFGLGTLGAGGGIDNGWNCTVFYNIDQDGDGEADNAPVDRLAYMTTGVTDNGTPIEGGIAQIRPDTEAIHGANYWDYTTDPEGLGDLGDADGIPDGDGQPDDPIPGWWLPYVRSVRVTVVATPSSIIEERMARSGQAGSTGDPVYYRLDNPKPFADPGRQIPLDHQKQDYIGAGADLMLTKTVPVNFAYKSDLVTDPSNPLLPQFNMRRVELNYWQGESHFFDDPVGYDTQIIPGNPVDKLWEMEPEQRESFFGQ